MGGIKNLLNRLFGQTGPAPTNPEPKERAKPANILVTYYSTYGHTWKMAQSVVAGAKSVGGTEVRLRRIPLWRRHHRRARRVAPAGGERADHRPQPGEPPCPGLQPPEEPAPIGRARPTAGRRDVQGVEWPIEGSPPYTTRRRCGRGWRICSIVNLCAGRQEPDPGCNGPGRPPLRMLAVGARTWRRERLRHAARRVRERASNQEQTMRPKICRDLTRRSV
jgi:hypothetical protein